MECYVTFRPKRSGVTEVAKRKIIISDGGEFVLATHYSWEIQKASWSERKDIEEEEVKLEGLKYS